MAAKISVFLALNPAMSPSLLRKTHQSGCWLFSRLGHCKAFNTVELKGCVAVDTIESVTADNAEPIKKKLKFALVL